MCVFVRLCHVSFRHAPLMFQGVALARLASCHPCAGGIYISRGAPFEALGLGKFSVFDTSFCLSVRGNGRAWGLGQASGGNQATTRSDATAVRSDYVGA